MGRGPGARVALPTGVPGGHAVDVKGPVVGSGVADGGTRMGREA